jgi:hypothetical protein
MTPASEPTPAAAVADPSPAVEVSEPSPFVEILEPSPAAGAVGTSSAIDAVTVEEVMELATCRYIDFPGVEVIDLEAPQLLEKVLEVVTERMFTEPSIMDTIASVSKALQEYERASGFAPTAAVEATDATLKAPASNMEPTADASAPPPASESREASLPQSVEAAEAPATIAETSAAEAVVGEAGSSPPRPVAAGADEVRALDEPATAVEERAAPKGSARAASPEIQEVEETGASLSQAAGSGEAWALELACTPWAAIFGSGNDSEEVAARNTLERGLNWEHRAFDVLILPTTSVSFLIQRLSSRFGGLLRTRALTFILLVADPRVFRSEMCPRGARASCREDSSGDATCRGPGGGRRCRGERGVRADVSRGRPPVSGGPSHHRRDCCCNGCHQAGLTGVEACARRGRD